MLTLFIILIYIHIQVKNSIFLLYSFIIQCLISCCIRDCSLFLYHSKNLVCFLFLAAVSLKNECCLLRCFFSPFLM